MGAGGVLLNNAISKSLGLGLQHTVAGSALRPGGGTAPPPQIVDRPLNLTAPQIVARPPNLAVLLARCGQLILGEKLVNLMPPDIRF